jgi:hypothetical protein
MKPIRIVLRVAVNMLALLAGFLVITLVSRWVLVLIGTVVALAVGYASNGTSGLIAGLATYIFLRELADFAQAMVAQENAQEQGQHQRHGPVRRKRKQWSPSSGIPA